jgi:hypothetical protein
MPRTCSHLSALETELESRDVRIGEPVPSPYGPEWGLWSPVDCTFDAGPLRARLGLADFIRFEEYDGRVAGSDATFYCPQCRRAIMGRHPRYAGATTPRIA